MQEYEPGSKEQKTISRQKILESCQISAQEFEKVVKEENFKKYLRIFEKDGEFCIMSEHSLYGILDDLLVLINSKFANQQDLNLDQILEANDGIIKSIYGPDEISFGLKHICIDGKLNRDLVQKAVAI